MEIKHYWGFWWRVLAYIIDTGFSILVIPIFINIYYYYKEGTTIWYKATWLMIKKSQDENNKPGWWRLLGRFLAKTFFSLLLLSVLWFLVSILFWVINITTWGSDFLNIIKWVVNWLLWILALLSFFWFFSWITIPFNKRKRALHDLLAKTVVIRTWLLNKRLLIIWCVLFIIALWMNSYSLVQVIEKQNQIPTDMPVQMQDAIDQAIVEQKGSE